ncbi:DUF3592 domain-containing protein [Micromonospora phytophila]|uniref:DUF3592 domain-containing protein n=1 Tax=Micromonospora phytophila TaxID=709888 RepID=UPI002030C785|nr:DUF3592 domain-containing protein [Micromonospora phytophila]MCM0674406.1 DUF3592 domain-containing protein [Micromonospora phytophila]
MAIFVLFYLTEGRTTVREWRLRLSGQTVNGRVTSVRRSVGRYGPVTRGSVMYSSPQGTHTITGHIAPDAEVGQDFLVRYLPGNPEVAVMSEGVIMLIVKTIGVIAVTAILIAIAVAFALGG